MIVESGVLTLSSTKRYESLYDLVLRHQHRLGVTCFVIPVNLDGKTDLLTGLLAGKQDWKCHVSLLVTFCGSKSLKVILIDSDCGAYPVLNPLVTL